MKADPRGVLTGTHFIDGDHACCEGALAAGARFAAGYPITPSTEIVGRFASPARTATEYRRWRMPAKVITFMSPP
jgi:2-oxoglutarate ferredoxin oxidoreductase subunit alpha